MDFDTDAFGRELETGIRRQLAAAGDLLGDPATAWPVLVDLGLPALEAGPEHGGLDLGLAQAVIMWEELGAADVPGPLADTVFALDCATAGGPIADYAGELAKGDRVASVTGLDRAEPALDGVVVTISDGPGPLTLSRTGLAAPAFATAVNRARIRQAALLTGMSRRALDEARAHVCDREQFGRRLVEFQAIAFPLTAALVDLDATRLLVRRAAWLADRGLGTELTALEALASAADLFAGCVSRAVHVHGTRGLLRAAPVARLYLHGPAQLRRFGAPGDLWRRAGRLRLETADDPEDGDVFSPAGTEQHLIPLRTGEGAPMFCVHPSGGSALSYLALAAVLSGDFPMTGIQAGGLDGRNPPLATVEELAERYRLLIERECPQGPIDLLGWSFGGTVAFELAVRLRDAGRETRVVLLDAPAPDYSPDPDRAVLALRFAADVAGMSGTPLPGDLTEDELRGLGADDQAARVHRALRDCGAIPEETEAGQIAPRLEVFVANLRAQNRYRPARPYDRPLLLVRASQSSYDSWAWSEYSTAGVEEVVVAGDHYSLVDQEIDATAVHIGRWLANQ